MVVLQAERPICQFTGRPPISQVTDATGAELPNGLTAGLVRGVGTPFYLFLFRENPGDRVGIRPVTLSPWPKTYSP